jgi:hypothetical protein
MDSIVTLLPATKTPLLVYLWMPVVAKPFYHAIVMQDIVAAGFENHHFSILILLCHNGPTFSGG